MRLTASGAPVADAKISIDGSYAVSTNEAGIYQLENIKTGTYTIQVEGLNEAGKDGIALLIVTEYALYFDCTMLESFNLSFLLGYHFAPSSIKITPNTPLLPDILPSRFDVCGRISIVQIPPALAAKFVSTERRVVITRAGDVMATISVKMGAEGGQFCAQLPAGDYEISVVTTEEEAGMMANIFFDGFGCFW